MSGVYRFPWRASTRCVDSLARSTRAENYARVGNRHSFTLQKAQPRRLGLPLGELLQASGSRADVKTLPHDADLLRMHVKSVAGMTPFEISTFAGLINKHGAAVLVPAEDPKDGLAAYSTLDRLLGTPVKHDQMNEHGIVEINPSRPTSINTANPQKPHLPHTDDAYTEQPSHFITLQCRQAAPSGGGETVLVSGVELLAALDSEELRSFMRPGLVSMGRRPAADGSWMQVSSIPMFWINQESGWLQLRWRCNDGCVQDVHEDAKNVYQRMDSVARGKVNQLVVNLAPKEIIVVDNRAVAHGRRTYDENEPRIMWRKNYVGDGQLAASLNVGMLQGFSSVLGDCSSIFDPATWEGDDPRVQ